MSAPELAPRSAVGGVVAVWVFAALVSLAIGFFAPLDTRASWLAVGLGGCLLFAFAIQLWTARSKGFIDRVAISAGGALIVMGVVSAVFGIVALFPA